MNEQTQPDHEPENYPPSLLNMEALVRNDPETAFYQLQNAMHQIFEWMTLKEKMRRFPVPIMNQVGWRNDGYDLSRASVNLVIQLVDIFNHTPKVSKQLCSESMRWPFLHDRFAVNAKSVKDLKESLGFKTSSTKKPSKGVGIAQLFPYTKLHGASPNIELENHYPTRKYIQKNLRYSNSTNHSLSLANTVLFHHLQEIEEYRASPPQLRTKYAHPSAHYVNSHNLSLSKGVQYTKGYDKPLPRFWEEWQSRSLTYPPLSKKSAKQWFELIWRYKICPEYLGSPAKKPHNPSLSSQADLTVLATAQALKRYERQAKTKAEMDRHLARIRDGKEDEGAMEGDIKQALRMAMNRHAGFRDQQIPNAIIFSW